MYRKAGLEARFAVWLKTHRGQTTNASELASLCWQLHDYPAAITALGKAARQEDSWSWQEQHPWEEKFGKLKREMEFLKVVSAARPQDLALRWRVLDFENRTRGPEAIEVMEKMLQQAADPNRGSRANPRFVYPLFAPL